MDHTERFDSPGEAADVLLGRSLDGLPDPAVVVGGASALEVMAEALCTALDDPYALYSPAQAAQFLAFVSGALDALGEAIPKACAAVEAARVRGDLPGHVRREIADERATLDEVGMWTSDSKGTLEPVAKRLANLADDYVGYADEGEDAQVHKLATELATRPGVTVGEVHEAQRDEDRELTHAAVYFMVDAQEYCLVFDLGWELAVETEGGGWRDIGVRGAFGSSVHPVPIVDEALAAIKAENGTGAA